MYNSSFEVFGQNDSAPCRRSQSTILFKISIFSVCVNLCWTWNVSFSRMPICSCGFTIRGILSAIQFLYVIVDKLCDIFIICTTKGYGFVDLHLFLKLVGFFCMYWCRWEKSHFIYNAILLAPKCSISDIYVVQLIQFYSLCFFAWLSQCRMSRGGERADISFSLLSIR